MNELLDAMIAEVNRLYAKDTEFDAKLADSLFAIVYDTRLNIARAEREHWLDKYQAMYPQDNKPTT